VTVRGILGNFTSNPGYLAIWSINNQSPASLSTSFTRVNISEPGGFPFSLTDIPNREAFLGSDASDGVNVYDYSKGINKIDIKPLVLPNLGATCWTVYSSKTGSYYVSDTVTGFISEVEVSADLTPRLVKVSNHYCIDLRKPKHKTLLAIRFTGKWG
jgi:hypothetical protein